MKQSKSFSACPHDCPSTCALEIEHDENNIFKVRGSKENSYTSGVICSKVSRYNERTHHKKRILTPLKRTGDKGLNNFINISWDEALDIVCEKFTLLSNKYTPETIWPYYYAGTMGLIQRDSINRLRHAFSYSEQHSTICNTLAATGFLAGVGMLSGPDPREVKYSELIIVWGGNPASTQVNFMKHIKFAKKTSNAKLIVIDPYETRTARVADYHYAIKPGTDGALACALMHIMFRDGYADIEYLKKYSDDYIGLTDSLKEKNSAWASKITGISIENIECLGQIIGKRKKVYTRLGYGFSRQRNGSANMHAVVSLSIVCGNWQYKGGGAFYTNSDIYNIDKTYIEGLDINNNTRMLDQSRIGSILTNQKDALQKDIPITGMIIQNTNPLVVAPDSTLVKEGFSRKDLFVCVHEQFMTETAKYADIVLPATTFVEHSDIYVSGGHQHITYGPKLINPIGKSWSNHKLINAIAIRLGSKYKPFYMNEDELIDLTLINSGYMNLKKLKKLKWIDVQPSFEDSHFLKGFKNDDKKFHFKPNWKKYGIDYSKMPLFPSHLDINEKESRECPFKLVTAPAHNFLNSSFTESTKSQSLEDRPKVKVHSNDLKNLCLMDKQIVKIGNKRGEVHLTVEEFNGLQEGVLVVEGIWPSEKFINGKGINTLVGSDPAPPAGGAAFHDVSVWIKAI